MKIKERIAQLVQEEKERYWDAIRLAKSKGKESHFPRTFHIHLPAWESTSIIKSICPGCELSTQCIKYIDSQSRKTCLKFSDFSGQMGKGAKWDKGFNTIFTIRLSQERSINPFDRFGQLEVIFDEPEKDKKTGNLLYLCECIICGKGKKVRGSDLLSGKVKSCGKHRKKTLMQQKRTARAKIPREYRKVGKSVVNETYSSRIGCVKNLGEIVKKPPEHWLEVFEDGTLVPVILEDSKLVFIPKTCTCGGVFRFSARADVVCDRCGLVDGIEKPIPFYRDWHEKVASGEVQPFIVGTKQKQITDWRDLIILDTASYRSDGKPWPFIITPGYTLTKDRFKKKKENIIEIIFWLHKGGDSDIIFGDLESKMVTLAASRERIQSLKNLKDKIKTLNEQLKSLKKNKPEDKALIASTLDEINLAKRQRKTVRGVSIRNIDIKIKGGVVRTLFHHTKTIEGCVITNRIQKPASIYPSKWNLNLNNDNEIYAIIRIDQVVPQEDDEKFRWAVEDFDGSQIDDPSVDDDNSPLSENSS